jgi:hypothetical protein
MLAFSLVASRKASYWNNNVNVNSTVEIRDVKRVRKSNTSFTENS